MNRFVSPPRPDLAVSPDMLPIFEKQGYALQVKKNGTYALIFVEGDGRVWSLNRHGEPHKAWEMGKENEAFFSAFAARAPVFCAEILHSKVPGIRDTIYVHDLISLDNKSLIGTTYQERYHHLLDLMWEPKAAETFCYYLVRSKIWLARNIYKDFLSTFKGLSSPEDEGVVVKKTSARWYPGKNSWCVKARRPNKNLSF